MHRTTLIQDVSNRLCHLRCFLMSAECSAGMRNGDVKAQRFLQLIVALTVLQELRMKCYWRKSQIIRLILTLNWSLNGNYSSVTVYKKFKSKPTFQKLLSQAEKWPVKLKGSNPCLIITVGVSSCVRPVGSASMYCCKREIRPIFSFHLVLKCFTLSKKFKWEDRCQDESRLFFGVIRAFANPYKHFAVCVQQHHIVWFQILKTDRQKGSLYTWNIYNSTETKDENRW